MATLPSREMPAVSPRGQRSDAAFEIPSDAVEMAPASKTLVGHAQRRSVVAGAISLGKSRVVDELRASAASRWEWSTTIVIAYTGIAAVNIDGGRPTRKRGSASVARSTSSATTPHPAVGVRHDDADNSARGSISSSNFRDCVLPIIDEYVYLFLGACF